MANPPHFIRSGSVPIAHLPPAILESLRKRNGPGWTPPPALPGRPDDDFPRILAPGNLVIRGHGTETGYGRMARMIATALEEQGQPVRFESIDVPRAGLHPWLAARWVDPGHALPTVQMSSPWAVHRPGMVLFSMWESDRLPPESVAVYNAARLVLVPCAWGEGVFRRSGVTAKTRVVPLGVDSEVYKPSVRNVSGTCQEPFTVLSVGAMDGGGHRKGMHDLVAAFLEALGDERDARLVLKINASNQLPIPNYPRVEVDRGAYSDAGMADLYRRASVYASMSRGEGWGMPILEAMACGVPYVGPIHTGIAAYARPDLAYPVDFEEELATGDYYDGHGRWQRPSVASMAAQLRAAYEDPWGREGRAEAAARRGSEFPWARSAKALLLALREAGVLPERTAGLARETRLTLLRRDCPDASRADCGCSDLRTCARGKGAEGRASREDCFRCLEAEHP